MRQIIRAGNPDHRLNAISMIKGLASEKEVDYEMKLAPYKKSKSLEQLGYFFAVIIPAVKDWQGLTDLEADVFLKDNCISPEYKEIMGKVYEIRKSISKMRSKEMSQYIDDTISFLGINGVYVPPPTYRHE